MEKAVHKAAADMIANLPWGSHFCHFYQTKKDLLDIMVPYIKAGLLNNEFCVWVTSKPLEVNEAMRAMEKALPKFDSYLEKGQIEIHPHSRWYLEDGVFNSRRVLSGWIDKCNQALAGGYEGLRLTGDTLWLKKTTWKHFTDYEEEVDRTVGKLRMKAVCTYRLDKCRESEVIDVVKNHGYAVIKRGEWMLIENAQRRHAEEQALERGTAESEKLVQARTAELQKANRKLRLEITERKRIEDDLGKQKEVLQTIIDHIPVMTRYLGADGRVELVNREWERTLGWTLEEIQRQNLDILSETFPDPEDRREVLKFVDESNGEWRDFKPRARNGRVVDTTWTVVHLSDGTRIGIGQDITARKRAEDELRTSREQLRALARYLQSVREEERTRIARELHDEIGQALTAIKFSLETSLRERSEIIKAGLPQALVLTNELIGRVRDLSLELRPAMLDDLGLLAALRWHFDPYTTQFRIEVDFKHAGLEGRRFEPEIETAAYRIVQEALTNVARHAGVDRVEVAIQADEGALRLHIKDQGNGFAPDSVTASITGGLSGMRERAIMLGGQLRIESAPGNGTVLVAELPLTNRQQAEGTGHQ